MAARKNAKKDPESVETTKNVVGSKYADRYKDNGLKTASGRKSIDNGDRVAKALRGADRKAVTAAAKDNGMAERLKGWSHLNDGQFKMTVSNAIRALVRSGEGAKIDGKAVRSL